MLCQDSEEIAGTSRTAVLLRAGPGMHQRNGVAPCGSADIVSNPSALLVLM